MFLGSKTTKSEQKAAERKRFVYFRFGWVTMKGHVAVPLQQLHVRRSYDYLSYGNIYGQKLSSVIVYAPYSYLQYEAEKKSSALQLVGKLRRIWAFTQAPGQVSEAFGNLCTFPRRRPLWRKAKRRRAWLRSISKQHLPLRASDARSPSLCFSSDVQNSRLSHDLKRRRFPGKRIGPIHSTIWDTFDCNEYTISMYWFIL